jgi:hypothetical protein
MLLVGNSARMLGLTFTNSGVKARRMSFRIRLFNPMRKNDSTAETCYETISDRCRSVNVMRGVARNLIWDALHGLWEPCSLSP